ncbi:hypothetical protein BU15DRAFT_78299 [Melanogaster broomeanus]|nr:hypothetical protein BU15DRAFT_78299 [Melanogaster broomeanus]
MSTTSYNESSKLSGSDALSARGTDGVAAKEVRAHEHARHRIKERREHALARERKERAAAVRAVGPKAAPGARLPVGAGRRKPSSMQQSWDGEVPEAAATATLLSVPAEAVDERGAASLPKRTSAFAELTLGDLVSRPRRQKANKLDFEVVPPVRAVIALDDFRHDIEADETWEYVTRSSLHDGPIWKGMSYAQAVATAM